MGQLYPKRHIWRHRINRLLFRQACMCDRTETCNITYHKVVSNKQLIIKIEKLININRNNV